MHAAADDETRNSRADAILPAGNRSRKMIVPEVPLFVGPRLVENPWARTVTLDFDRHKKFVQLPDQAQFVCVKSTPKQRLRKTHWSQSFTRNVFHLSVVQFAECIPKIYRIRTFHSTLQSFRQRTLVETCLQYYATDYSSLQTLLSNSHIKAHHNIRVASRPEAASPCHNNPSVS